MTEATWNLLLQIPLAGVVVIVCFIFLRNNKENLIMFMQAQREQISLFMGAIKKQRDANNIALGELTKAVRDMQNEINVRMDKLEDVVTHNKSEERKHWANAKKAGVG